MEGVTTAIVLFIFACVLMPKIVKHRPQFYAALAAVIGVIAVQSVGQAFERNEANQTTALFHLAMFIAGSLQIVAILLLILACGGITPDQLAGEFKNAYEVMRRGSEEKEIIIPRSDEQPAPRPPARPATAAPRQAPPATGVRPAAPPRPRRATGESGPIPLE